jgi:hypothetical protein
MFYFYVLQPIRDKDLYLDLLPKFLSVGVLKIIDKFFALSLKNLYNYGNGKGL